MHAHASMACTLGLIVHIMKALRCGYAAKGFFVVMGVIDNLGMHYPAFFLKKIAKTTQTMIPTAYGIATQNAVWAGAL